MIGLISTVVGFLSTVLPLLVNYLITRQNQKHELEITKLRIEAVREGIDPIKLAADIAAIVREGENLRYHDSVITTNEYINILRGSVRPLLTYFFFFLFIGIKTATASLMFEKGYDAFKVLDVVWDSYTQSLFGAILGFWFGTRSMIYFSENIQNGTLVSVVKPTGKK